MAYETNARQNAKRRADKADDELTERAIQEHDENEAKTVALARKQSWLAYLQDSNDSEAISVLQLRLLVEIAQDGLVSYACKRAGVPVRTHYGWLQKSAAYKEAYNEAIKIANEYLEQTAINLATGVYRRPLVSQGKLVTTEAIYDGKMLQFLLKARNPEKFGNKLDVTSGGQSLVKYIDREAYDSV